MTAVSDVTLKKNIFVYQIDLFIERNNMSIENKLKNAKLTTWLTDGLSDSELKIIKIKTSIYLIWIKIYIFFKNLFKED